MNNAFLDRVSAAGGIGTGAIIPRTVEWNGQKFDLHFLDLPGGMVNAMLKKGGEDADISIIVAALCLEDGSPALDRENAEALKLTLREAIVLEAMDVFGFSAKARKEKKTDSDPTP